MPIRAYCCIPDLKRKSSRAKEGSCPQLLYDLFSELEGASEIYVAVYLFNNPTYCKFLLDQSEKGCKIEVTSLPISGYGDKPKKVNGYLGKVSARQKAHEIYQQLNSSQNIELRIFPHLYMWYGALYANGGPSYSFHVKAIYAKFLDKSNKCILSSGNFMFTDPYHSDNFIVIENIPDYEKAFAKFYDDLRNYSIPYKIFEKDYKDYKDHFLYSFPGKEINLNASEFTNCFFTAPFYLYNSIGSNHYAGSRIIELIKHANKRIWICSQHFHDLISFDPARETFIKALYDKFLSNPKIEFRFLKQVPHSSLADKRRAGIAETLFQFVMNAQQKYNNLVHDKFMLIDNTLLISTANYTPTQFAFGRRKMIFRNKDKEIEISKEDNFSEVNGFAIIPDCLPDVIHKYEKHFNLLWGSGDKIVINL